MFRLIRYLTKKQVFFFLLLLAFLVVQVFADVTLPTYTARIVEQMQAGEEALSILRTGGIMLAKFVNIFAKKKINPMVGSAGISAFPMASRIVQKLGLQEDPSNHLLMHAAGANVAGQISSVIAGGILMALAGI